MSREADFESPTNVSDDEDENTLKAIDEGIRDARAGRTFSLTEIRKLLPQQK